jgi:hypothetical protein
MGTEQRKRMGAESSHLGMTVPQPEVGAQDSDLYEKHRQWSADNGHDPETVVALRSHEKSGGLTRTQANKVANLAYIGGGDSNWRSQGHLDQ